MPDDMGCAPDFIIELYSSISYFKIWADVRVEAAARVATNWQNKERDEEQAIAAHRNELLSAGWLRTS